MKLEEIDSKIKDLEKQLSCLRREKEELEVENLKIDVGSIIRSEGIFYDAVEDYEIILIQLHVERDYKFGLLDARKCIWNDLIFNSLDEIKDMMREEDGEKWSVVKL